MKTKTPIQVYDPSKQVSPQVISHIQALTDDIRSITSGGLSFQDAQLPFQIVTMSVRSGTPVNLRIQAPFRTSGCIPIQTNGSTILSYKTIKNNDTLSITVTMDVESSNITFMLIG